MKEKPSGLEQETLFFISICEPNWSEFPDIYFCFRYSPYTQLQMIILYEKQELKSYNEKIKNSYSIFILKQFEALG